MWVYTGSSLPEYGAGIQLAVAVAIDCKYLEIKAYARRRSKGINTGDAGSLEIWLGSVDGVFVEDGHC